MNTLTHPATIFLQTLATTDMAFRDMPPQYQKAMFNYMVADGDGIWAEFCASLSEAVERFGDVRFLVGSFPNNDLMKRAFAACATDGEGDQDPIEWFDQNCVTDCVSTSEDDTIPVVMADARIPEFGLFDDGFDRFYDYWTKQPYTEFVQFRPDWNPCDDSGRGGQ